jgi:hypothetical protein
MFPADLPTKRQELEKRMVRKSKIVASLAAAGCMFLIAGTSLSAVSASASGPGAANCVVTGGTVTIDSGGGITAAPPTHTDLFHFVGFTIACTGSDADDNGNWTISASGHSDNESCASATGGGTITGGTSPNGAAGDGSVTGGSFTFARGAAGVAVEGNITTAGENHTFAAALAFTPSDGECSGTGTGPTTHAGINGTAVVTE